MLAEFYHKEDQGPCMPFSSPSFCLQKHRKRCVFSSHTPIPRTNDSNTQLNLKTPWLEAVAVPRLAQKLVISFSILSSAQWLVPSPQILLIHSPLFPGVESILASIPDLNLPTGHSFYFLLSLIGHKHFYWQMVLITNSFCRTHYMNIWFTIHTICHCRLLLTRVNILLLILKFLKSLFVIVYEENSM